MKKIVMFVLSLALCLFLSGCGFWASDNNDEDKKEQINPIEIVSVSVQTMPYKTFYTVGDTFVPDGGELRIERANGNIEDISFSDENISLFYPSTLSYWTDNQRIGVCYNDPLNGNATSETVYFGVKVGLDFNYKPSGYSRWYNDDLFICYPDNYTAQENEGDVGIGGVIVVDHTKNIVTFSDSHVLGNLGTGKSISIKSGSVNTLYDVLDRSISFLDSYYTQQYQEAYRKSYGDDTLEVTVQHQGLTNAEYNALEHLQWKDAIHQIIKIKKSGTALGLGDWEKRVDRYILRADGNTIDISFWANNSVYSNGEVQKVLRSLVIKYSTVYTDAP